MRDSVVVAVFAVAVTACVHPSLYQGWGKQLVELPRQNARVDDVSLLLGTPPSRCDFVETRPTIGATWSGPTTIVLSVIPNGPADQAGLRPGDRIVAVDGQATANGEQAQAAIRRNAREGQPLQIETNRGIVSPIPKLAKAEQCYWDVPAGPIARTGSSAYVNQYGGAAASGGSASARFFRASCRIHDGFVVGCQTNWQE